MADKFLQEFQQGIDKLNGFKTRLEQKTTEKAAFNDNLITSLKGIKDNIASLSSKITDFKLIVDGLQGQVAKNDANVKGKEEQLASIAQQVTNLEEQKKQLTDQLAQVQEQINKQGLETQQKINTYEDQLRDLTAKNAEIQKQLDTVTAELNGKEDTQTQHSQQLQTQAEEAKQQLEAQSQANQEEQTKLTAKINELESNLADLRKQLQDKTGETVAHVDTINKKEQECQSQIAELTAKLKDLQTTNDDLINRIATATGVINSTVDKLQELIMNEPNPNNITNEIAEIEQSIENIGRVIQGQSTAQQRLPELPELPAQLGLPGKSDLPGTTEITIQGTKQTLDEVKNQLSIKSQQLKKAGYLGPDKYADTLVKLRGARTPGDVEQIVTRVFRDGKVWGGKKTKKHRHKQKGGFVYKPNSRRKTITTSKQRGGFIYKDSTKRRTVTTSSTKRKRRTSK